MLHLFYEDINNKRFVDSQGAILQVLPIPNSLIIKLVKITYTKETTKLNDSAFVISISGLKSLSRKYALRQYNYVVRIIKYCVHEINCSWRFEI